MDEARGGRREAEHGTARVRVKKAVVVYLDSVV
jgi:hypothetical protein